MRLFVYIGFILFLILIGCNDSNLTEKRIYNKNGNLKEKYFIDQNKRIQGLGYEYYDDGHIKEIREYYDGKSNGKFRDYYPNGKLRTKGKFKNDIQIDTTFYFLDNGHLDAVAIYDKNGNTIKETSFYPNGKVHIVRSYFVDGSGQINAFKTYFENGKLNEAESNFAKLKLFEGNKDSLSVKLYNCQYTDSIYVNIIKSFNYQYSFEAEIIRTLKFTNLTELKFRLLNSDFVYGKVNIQIIGKKYASSKLIQECGYYIQISNGCDVPKDNVEGIYKVY